MFVQVCVITPALCNFESVVAKYCVFDYLLHSSKVCFQLYLSFCEYIFEEFAPVV
jgi:hypothetical protein